MNAINSVDGLDIAISTPHSALSTSSGQSTSGSTPASAIGQTKAGELRSSFAGCRISRHSSTP